MPDRTHVLEVGKAAEESQSLMQLCNLTDTLAPKTPGNGPTHETWEAYTEAKRVFTLALWGYGPDWVSAFYTLQKAATAYLEAIKPTPPEEPQSPRIFVRVTDYGNGPMVQGYYDDEPVVLHGYELQVNQVVLYAQTLNGLPFHIKLTDADESVIEAIRRTLSVHEMKVEKLILIGELDRSAIPHGLVHRAPTATARIRGFHGEDGVHVYAIFNSEKKPCVRVFVKGGELTVTNYHLHGYHLDLICYTPVGQPYIVFMKNTPSDLVQAVLGMFNETE